jgi:hypothetical protein
VNTASRAACLCAAAFFCFSCSFFRVQPSRLALEKDGSRLTLFALNKNALDSEIAPEPKSSYLYYRFDNNFAAALKNENPRVPALELSLKTQGGEPQDAVFFFGFLFENDFETPRGDKTQRLKKTLEGRPLARIPQTAMRNDAGSVSLAFPRGAEMPLGFMCYAAFPVAVTGAKIVPAEIYADPDSARFAFSQGGGSALSQNQMQGALSPRAVSPLFLLENGATPRRAADYELYAWDRFSSVLFFDTKNYAVQDEFFKRLAFFAEKKGFRGKLVAENELSGLHGFNALDFRASTLAQFFSLAQKTEFALNAREKLLCDILTVNGIIVETEDGFAEGEGAVVSISQESPSYLRRQLIVHEGLHALFFLHEDFRSEVERVYNETDPLCVRFLERYFDVTPSLAYDITDRYLLINEFMSYLLQQPVSSVSRYFSRQVANYTYINRYEPGLAQYVRDTNARGFVESAEKLSAYIERVWGLEAGRLW